MYFLRYLAMFIMVLSFTSCSSQENKTTAVKILTADNQIIREFVVELADTKETANRGLMGRMSLDKNSGMLFDVNTIPADMDVAMWMKDTLIPLDMIFLDDRGVIFYIYQNAKPYDTTPIYPPMRPRGVLEINAGQVTEYDIKIGDIVVNEMFNPE